MYQLKIREMGYTVTKKLFYLIVIVIFFPVIDSAQAYEAIPSFNENDKILILAPHPDDEVLGCAGVIQKAQRLNLPLKVVFFTYGDNNEWSFLVYRKHPVISSKSVLNMGLVRYKEAMEADTSLGLLPEQLVFLGYPDFGTLDIWYKHWAKRPPFKSMLTKVSAVPYKNAFRPGAPYKGEEVVRDLAAIIRDFRPTRIFLSHPADHNVDHRALYLFTNVALWDLGMESTVTLYPFLVHYKSWPLPRGHHLQEELLPPGIYEREISWKTSVLNADEVALKEDALKKHHSQFESAASYLDAFVRENELFGDFVKITLDETVVSSHAFVSRKAELADPPEELIDKERASFIGIEEHSISMKNGSFVFRLSLSRGLAQEVGLSVYLFGYRQGMPFAKMPKIRARFGAFFHAVYDQDKMIELRNAGITITRQERQITITVPMVLLGNPDHILTSANTYLGDIPLDWVSWRILEILPKQKTKEK
jgi:LmbE family N-acetylglucosaminyl deacetylase